MTAAQMPPDTANHTKMQASAGSRSCSADGERLRLGRAARDICVIPEQGRMELNRPENKEALIPRRNGVRPYAAETPRYGPAR